MITSISFLMYGSCSVILLNIHRAILHWTNRQKSAREFVFIEFIIISKKTMSNQVFSWIKRKERLPILPMTREKQWENGHLITFIIYLNWTITIISISKCSSLCVCVCVWNGFNGKCHSFVWFEWNVISLEYSAEIVYFPHAFTQFFSWFSGDLEISINEFAESGVCTNGTFCLIQFIFDCCKSFIKCLWGKIEREKKIANANKTKNGAKYSRRKRSERETHSNSDTKLNDFGHNKPM